MHNSHTSKTKANTKQKASIKALHYFIPHSFFKSNKKPTNSVAEFQTTEAVIQAFLNS